MKDVLVCAEAESVLMKLLSSKTGSLRQLFISVHITRGALFEDLACLNPLLERVNVGVSASEDLVNLDEATSLFSENAIRSFSQCKFLKELCVSYMNSAIRMSQAFQIKNDNLADMCLALRRRGAFVKIGDIDYLP